MCKLVNEERYVRNGKDNARSQSENGQQELPINNKKIHDRKIKDGHHERNGTRYDGWR